MEVNLLDYTERTNAVDLKGSYHIHVETEGSRIALENRSSECCPFCGTQLEIAVHLRHKQTGDDLRLEQILAKLDGRIVFESHTDILTYHCVHCGWWRVENRSSANPSVDYIFPTLKKFNVGSRDLPLGILWTEILKKPDLLLLINCTVFERFVAEVLSSELGIKVKHIGRTGDGGIDLFYCHGDQNCAIQVKRRTKNDSVEGVSLVREFLGAMLLGGYNNGKIVTTANRFTDGAYRAKSVAEEKGLVSSIDLVDKNEFLINFKYDPSRASCPWEYVFYDVATKTDWGPNYQVIINKSTILKNRI